MRNQEGKAIGNLRQRMSTKLWSVADQISDFKNRVRNAEERWIHKYVPLPSKAVDAVYGIVANLAWRVDDDCDECGWSPGHSVTCSKSCPVKEVMET